MPNDPALELIELLANLRMVRQCSSLIHSNSNVAFLLEAEMQSAHKGKDLISTVNLAQSDLVNTKSSGFR